MPLRSQKMITHTLAMLPFILISLTFCSSKAIGIGEYGCRLRHTGITPPEVTRGLIGPNFRVEFEFEQKNDSVLTSPLTTTGTGYSLEKDGTLNLYYRVEKPGGMNVIKAIAFQGKPALLDKVGGFEVRCKSLDNDRSYILKQRSNFRDANATFVRYTVTMQRQNDTDCYLEKTNIDPYTLQPSPMYVANGERYYQRCSIYGRCEGGLPGGVSVCPPYPQLTSEYTVVHKQGLCCEHPIKMAAIQKQGCPRAASPIITDGQPLNYDAPWLMRIRANPQGVECDGAILATKFVIFPTSCITVKVGDDLDIVQKPGQISNLTVAAKTILGAADGKLTLVKLTSSLVEYDWTEYFQPINLPWSLSLCVNLSGANCHIAIGAKREGVEAGQPVPPSDERTPIVDGQITDRSLCSSDDSPKRFCVKKSTVSPVQKGAFVSSWVENVNFLLGLYAGKAPASLDANMAGANDSGIVYSICLVLDEIKQAISTSD